MKKVMRASQLKPVKYAYKIPYSFVLDHLIGLDIEIKRMFGCYAIYAHGRICLFLVNRKKPIRTREQEPMRNGIYIATEQLHQASLKQVFPNAEFERLAKGKAWIFVSEGSTDFENTVIAACELIARHDQRIGR